MSSRLCDKKCASLLWTLLECIFFSGVVLGWSWLALIFRADHYFLSGCNVTLPDLTSASPRLAAAATTPTMVVVGRLERRPCRKKPSRPPEVRQNLALIHHHHHHDRARVLRHASKQLDLRRFRVRIQGGSLRGFEGSSSGAGVEVPTSSSAHPVFQERGVVKNLTRNEHQLSKNKVVGAKDGMMVVTVPAPPSIPLPLVGGKEEDGVGKEDEEEGEEEEVVCSEQREMLRLLLAVVAVLRDLFVFPVGAFFDKYGTTRTRLLTVLIFAVGTLMMTFITQDVPLLMLPALTLTGVAGVAVLLTNIQIANMFGRRRHLVMALYCGASLTSGFITYMMQLSHEQGVHVQTSFMFLTIGLVPMLVSTVAFLPKTRVPWPLPNNYGQRRQQSLDENLLQAGVVKLRRPVPKFWPRGDHQLLVGAMIWHGVHSLHTAQAETLLVDFGHVKNGLQADMEHVFGWLQLLSLPLSLLPGLLIDRRRPRELGVEPGTHQMRGILPAMVLASAVALGERAFLMLGVGAGGEEEGGPGVGVGAVSCLVLACALHALHRVCFLVVSLAFLLHVHFAQEHVGKYVGLTWSVSACISALQFPLRLYLTHQPFVLHSLMLTLVLLTFAHVFNVWNCCRRRLIRDRPSRTVEGEGTGCGQALLSIHIHCPEPPTTTTTTPGDMGSGSGGHSSCPETSGCCPGPSGQSGRKSSSCQTEEIGLESGGYWERGSSPREKPLQPQESTMPGHRVPKPEDLMTSEESGHRVSSPPGQMGSGLSEGISGRDEVVKGASFHPHRKSSRGQDCPQSPIPQREGEDFSGCSDEPHKKRIEWKDLKDGGSQQADDTKETAEQTTRKTRGRGSEGQDRGERSTPLNSPDSGSQTPGGQGEEKEEKPPPYVVWRQEESGDEAKERNGAPSIIISDVDVTLGMRT